MSIPPVILTLALSLISQNLVDGARILALLPYNARSHFIVMEPLLLALHAKGHHLTVVSSYPREAQMKNYRDIDLSQSLPTIVSKYSIESIREKMPNVFKTAKFITEIHLAACETVLQDQRVLALLNETFDLVIGEIFGSDCFNYIPYILKVPYISWVTSTQLPWGSDRIGFPDNPSYIPNYFVDYSDRMSFPQRIINLVTLLYCKATYYLHSEVPSHRLAEEVFNSTLPPMGEVNRQTALVLVNSHHSLAQSRPFPPNVIEVGGIHIKEVKPLPQDLKKVLDDAPFGVVLFSFGSLVRAASLPRPLILTLLRVFARLQQTVIFKYEEELLDTPSNVVVRQWLPQSDIIAHPNVKAVVTHCGLASTIEAVYFAKPMIGIPFFSDQFQNAKNIVRRGGGFILDIDNLTEDELYNAFRAVLDDPKYTENMKRLSLQFRDRPMTPLETAVYWTEYVIRHQGAPHLRPASVDLFLYQYLLLDVVAVLLACIVASGTALFFTAKLYYFLLCNTSKNVQTSKLKAS